MKRKAGRPKALPNDRLVKVLASSKYTQASLAEKLGVTRQSVNYWCDIGVPASRVPEVARLLKVQPRTLRPDVFKQR
jgi:DNA-binding transcriptional regulator YdaS (Cro superfamily)